MGDKNQFEFVKANFGIVNSPILEVGSKDYGNTPPFRNLFPDSDYVGIDMFEGKGVDTVVDLTDDIKIIDDKLNGKKFKTIICFSVLEHCKNPFKMCENITKLLDEDGIVFISVPFSWEIHAFPDDFWRFTPSGIKLLFPDVDFETHQGNISTSKTGETAPISNKMFRAELSTSKGRESKQYGFITSLFVRLFIMLGICPFIFKYKHMFPPVMINMIGKK